VTLARHLAVVLLLLSLAATARDGRRGQVAYITVHGASLENNRVGESLDRAVAVYLPPDYDKSTQRYPVLYLLHGYTGDERGWMNPSYADLSETMDSLIRKNTIQPLIVVMPNAFNRFGGSFYVNSVLSGNWEDFIVRDLVTYIDAHYRTLPVAASRGIAGHSMGGYGALRIGMEHPDEFSVAYGMSACCVMGDDSDFREDVVLAQKAKNLKEVVAAGYAPQFAYALAAAFSPNLHHPPLGVDWPFDAKGHPVPEVLARWKANQLETITAQYAAGTQRLNALAYDVGTQDTLVLSGRWLDKKMTELGVPHKYSEYDGNHNNRIHDRMEKFVLPIMSKELKGSN
jgi:enterochelin esterase-like enzyme